MEQDAEPQVTVAISHHLMSDGSISLAEQIETTFAKLKPLKGTEFRSDQLDLICKNIRRWSLDRIFEELEGYLLRVFPVPAQERAQNPRPDTRKPTRRQVRRTQYAQTQRVWRKNPCRCLRAILRDTVAIETPKKEVMIPYWQAAMSGGDNTSPGIRNKRQVVEALWCPILPEEVKEACPEMSTAPGPDGLTARQLKAVPLEILTRILNLFVLCGRLPEYLLESRTVLIPKKNTAKEPGDFRPITVSSVLTRTFHKTLARRLTRLVELDKRQMAFVPADGCAENIFRMDMILRYHRQYFKPLYMASVDLAKAFDSVTHATIRDTMVTMGLPDLMIGYVENVYDRSLTRLTCTDWQSELIHPTCGVKQGDPLSPVLFNMVIDGLLQLIPKEVGVDIAGDHFNALMFADDMVLVASTPQGLQLMLDTTIDFLAQCGLTINTQKSFTVAVRNVPHLKKTVIDGRTKFNCRGFTLPALRREDEWKYLGVPFTPEGRTVAQPEVELLQTVNKLTKAALKPQQRLFALRVMVLPGLYHLLTLGNTNLSRLKKIDKVVRGAVRKWLALPHDVVNAYIHASAKDGGLAIPSMRWLMPLRRKERLLKLTKEGREPCPYLSQEIGRARRRLLEGRDEIMSKHTLERRWARLLHSAIDGIALKESGKVPQQHNWVTLPNHFLSGKDFLNSIKLRINALPTRSRTTRGRRADRLCRAGCNAIETLNHVLQQCHRTHSTRVARHNAIAAYVQRALCKGYDRVDEEPHFITEGGLRKPDIVAAKDRSALVIDAQVVSEQADLNKAHQNKVEYYKELEGSIKTKYNVDEVRFTSVTLSCRGIWSRTSATDLTSLRIIKKTELKILSTRALIGGLSAFWLFNRSTSVAKRRTGIG